VLHQDQIKRRWVGTMEAVAWKSLLENKSIFVETW
jgi:hypothetical protein